MIGQAGLVPVYKTIVADLDTPLTIFAKVAGKDEHAFLFESMEGGEKWGRFSFIGMDPLVTFESLRDSVSYIYPDSAEKNSVKKGVNPLDELRQLIGSFDVVDAPGLPKFKQSRIKSRR